MGLRLTGIKATYDAHDAEKTMEARLLDRNCSFRPRTAGVTVDNSFSCQAASGPPLHV